VTRTLQGNQEKYIRLHWTVEVQ